MAEPRNYVVVGQDARGGPPVEVAVRAFGVADALAEISARRDGWLDVVAIYPVVVPFATLKLILGDESAPSTQTVQSPPRRKRKRKGHGP